MKNVPLFFRKFLKDFLEFLKIISGKFRGSPARSSTRREVLAGVLKCIIQREPAAGSSGRAWEGYTQRRLKSPPIDGFSGPFGNNSLKSGNPISGIAHFSLRFAILCPFRFQKCPHLATVQQPIFRDTGWRLCHGRGLANSPDGFLHGGEISRRYRR